MLDSTDGKAKEVEGFLMKDNWFQKMFVGIYLSSVLVKFEHGTWITFNLLATVTGTHILFTYYFCCKLVNLLH